MIKHMKSKKIQASYDLSVQVQKQLFLKDAAVALEYGQLPADRRVQIKMPAAIVDELDRVFAHVDRSKLLTQLAVEALLYHARFLDRPDLGDLARSEQEDLDQMWNYLEERDAQ
jgi:hypothetical protein